MGMFKDMLGADETLFKNPVALDYDYVPKLLPFRENEQFRIASCIKPMLQKRNARNIIIHGTPGIGKTVACKHVLRELSEDTDEVIPIYINCWQKNTSYKIIMEICDTISYKLTHNKKTDELLDIVVKILNKKSAVLVFDEIDKVDDYDFLYYFLESIYRKSIILITNHKEWFAALDDRIRSRLLPELLEFNPYSANETRGILRERVEYGFYEGVFEEEAFDIVVDKTFAMKDIRTGLYLLKEAGTIAEDESSKKITPDHVKKAVEKLDEFSVKKSTGLEDESRAILHIIKENSGKKIGDLFNLYKEQGGQLVYKSFQRKIAKLEKGKFISVKKSTGGSTGTTSIISYSTVKKLTDF